MKRPRRNHSAVFKAKVALAAVKGDQTLAALAGACRPAGTRQRAGAATAAGSG